MEVHQQHHGYLRGHQLLASSIKLERDDQDLIDRLSDIAGSIQGGSDVPNYLTGYPLPSGKFFVFARTWYDDDAQRAGCVLTHSLLVPLEAWAENPTPSSLRDFHRRFPHADMSPLLPLDWHTDVLDDDLPAEFQNASSELVEALFLEKNAPVLWVANDADNAVVRVIDALWPWLRKRFAFQTYALKPRYLADRPFDLVVTPSSSRSRFGEWPGRRVEGSGQPRHPWTLQLTREIFHDPRPSLARVDPLGILSSENSGDQSNLRMSLHWNDLNEKSDNPTVSLGMLDILSASPVPPERATTLLEGIVERVFLQRLWREFPGGAGKFIELLISKLERLPASPRVTAPLREAARNIFVEDPDSARELVVGSKPRSGRYSQLLTQAFLEAAGQSRSPDFADMWLMLDDQRFTDFFLSQSSLIDMALKEPGSRNRLADRLERSFSVYPRQVQDRVRQAVLGQLQPETATLVPLLLADLEERDLSIALKPLLDLRKEFQPSVLAALLSTKWSPARRSVVRQGIASSKLPTFEKGSALAKLLTPTREELNWLLTLPTKDVIATFAASKWKGEKIADAVERDADLGRSIVRLFLTQDRFDDAARIVSRLTLPLDERLALLEEFSAEPASAALRALVSDILRSVFPVRNAKEARTVLNVLASPGATEAFADLRPNELVDLLFPDRNPPASEIEATLRLLVDLPEESQRVVARSSDRIARRMMEFAGSKLTKRIFAVWADWIEGLAPLATKPVQEAADRTLSYALNHSRKPVSPLILASFPITLPVARASRQRVQGWFFAPSLSLATALIFDVADAFYHSDLPPRDLAVLAVRTGATDEIFGRLQSKFGGYSYLRRMFKDLNPKRSEEEKQARKYLRSYT